VIITISVSEEQVRRAEKLAQTRRMRTGESASRSSEIGRAIDALFLAERLTDTTDDILVNHPEPADVPA
jgi:hypothetical protein